MQPVSNLYDYLRAHAVELGERILRTYPALHQVDDPPSPRLGELLRQVLFSALFAPGITAHTGSCCNLAGEMKNHATLPVFDFKLDRPAGRIPIKL
jgi:hypothetical protein